ncbi:unnamed protein product, partial [Staurois parvus]
MLLPGSRVSHGSPVTASQIAAVSHRHTLPCATFRSPHTAGVFHFFVIGCWQITGLPLLLPGPVICHGPQYNASSCCCQVQSLSWVPVRPPIAAVSIATLCHVPLSGLPHTAGVFHFL